MPLGRVLLAVAFLAAACAGPVREPGEPLAPARAFPASSLRRPAVFVRVQVGPGGFSERQAAALVDDYEGALVEALDARAISARDVQRVSARARIDGPAAVARAREVGADHALVVEARIAEAEQAFCRDTRRGFRAVTATWSQRLLVYRAADGALAYATAGPVEVGAIEPDCETPRDSVESAPPEHVAKAVDALLARVLGDSDVSPAGRRRPDGSASGWRSPSVRPRR